MDGLSVDFIRREIKATLKDSQKNREAQEKKLHNGHICNENLIQCKMQCAQANIKLALRSPSSMRCKLRLMLTVLLFLCLLTYFVSAHNSCEEITCKISCFVHSGGLRIVVASTNHRRQSL